jgi:homoserine kinase
MIQLRVPATSANLGPGFDAFGIALNLYNEFVIREKNEGALPPGFSLLPRKNLGADAALLLARKAKLTLPELEFGIRAQVPRARGLGSSATLTIAGIKAADALLQTHYSDAELIALASQIEGHPDNAAPALLGGFVISIRNGQNVQFFRSLPPKPLQVVVGVPDFELHTVKSRQALPEQVSLKDAAFNVSRAGLLAASLISGQYELLRRGMEDRLHQPYRQALVPGLDKVMEAVIKKGALGTCLSGSGPTILVFCQNQAQALQQVIKKTWAEAGIKARTYHLQIAANGTEVISLSEQWENYSDSET